MKKYALYTDTQLVTIYQQTLNPLAYAELYERYYPKVFLYCVKLTSNEQLSQDLTQDIFVKISKKLLQLNEPGSFVKWLFMLARNQCMDNFRKAKRVQYYTIDSFHDLSDEPTDIEVLEDKERQLIALKGELEKLSNIERSLIIDRYFNQTPLIELVTKYQISESGIKMRLMRTRKKLKKAIAA